ncbi:GGAT1, partial [Symbiodinium pilosum]
VAEFMLKRCSAARRIVCGLRSGFHAYMMHSDKAFLFNAQQRDGFPADPKAIYLTTGASEGVTLGLVSQFLFIFGGFSVLGASVIVEVRAAGSDICVDFTELQQAAADAFTDGTKLRAITVINPGNPVGAVLDREDIVMIINFATEQKLVILADEVYQANVYAEGKKFHSFKKVLRELQAEDQMRYKETQLISFHSTSKGIIGECGQRGGYMEYVGLPRICLLQAR